jgi:hypothetical protein
VICDFGKAEYFFKVSLTRWLQNSLTGKSVEPCAVGIFAGVPEIQGRPGLEPGPISEQHI